jgi:hypothetical protein
MNRQREICRQAGWLTLAGLLLVAIAFFSPDAGHQPGAFFSVARQTTWRNLLDFPAAWCSVKIILFSLGLFLLIESAGTFLSVWKFKSLALSVFFLQVLPCLGLLFGGFYLVKSLL